MKRRGAKRRRRTAAVGRKRPAPSARKKPAPKPARRKSVSASEVVRRIWARDARLWHSAPAHLKEISNRLGWLDVAGAMRGKAGDLVWFARDVRSRGFTRAILLGMGGSSLAPEVFRGIFGKGEEGIDLTVLDTTDPGAIRAAEEAGDISRTLFIVSSKSGGTIEVDSLFRHFFAKTGGNGSQFVAITDPGTGLAKLAWEKAFLKVFTNPPDIGGRYSALSYFGLVPAALLGVDTGRVLDRALEMMRRCGPKAPVAGNPGLLLGRTLGQAALAGRDKVTLVLPRALEPLGLWVEQLLAESTGKDGRGLVPVAGEPLGRPESYGSDRVFVGVSPADSLCDPREEGEIAGRLDALESAGHPVVRLKMGGKADLGGEFFRWEFATAVAGAILGVDPFDQPNVQEAKVRTRALLDRFAATGEMPGEFSGVHMHGLHLLLSRLEAGRDYLAVLAFIPFDRRAEGYIRGALDWIRDRKRVATTFGYGPRYLHSTGQLHKGGGGNGVFVLITCDGADDIPVPGAEFTFGQLERAQAIGDLESLTARGRRVVRVHLPSPDPRELESVMSRIILGEGGGA